MDIQYTSEWELHDIADGYQIFKRTAVEGIHDTDHAKEVTLWAAVPRGEGAKSSMGGYYNLEELCKLKGIDYDRVTQP